MQAGQVLPRTRRLSRHRKPAYPASRTRVIEADHAALCPAAQQDCMAASRRAASPTSATASGFICGHHASTLSTSTSSFSFQFQATANCPLCGGGGGGGVFFLVPTRGIDIACPLSEEAEETPAVAPSARHQLLPRSAEASKGLRQGDPLSPILFNLIVDMLVVLIERAKELSFFMVWFLT
jgi:hypothetical protein